MKYNYHALVDAVYKNPKFVLPADINTPVVKQLAGVECEVGVEELDKFEKSVGYGRIELVHDDVPDAKITVKVNCGMASEGIEKSTTVKKGKWTAHIYRTIKNANITKRKEAKDGHRDN